MRGLALCLAAAVLAVAGCGSDNGSSRAPNQENVTASGATGAPAAVSAKGRATPASLCSAEGKGKPKRQCVAGLKKLDKGKAANPKAACKGMSKKKTKGVRGKSPFAVCVSAAAKLMSGKQPNGSSGNGAADGQTADSDAADGSDDDDSPGKSGKSDDEEPDPICVDANGKTVPFDSEDVEECEPVTTSASDSSSDDDSADSSDSSDDDSSDDSSGDDE